MSDLVRIAYVGRNVAGDDHVEARSFQLGLAEHIGGHDRTGATMEEGELEPDDACSV